MTRLKAINPPLAIRRHRHFPERIEHLPWEVRQLEHIAPWANLTPWEVQEQLQAGKVVRTDYSNYSMLPEFRGKLLDIVA